MRLWIEFRDEQIKEYEVEDMSEAMTLVNEYGLTVKDWDIASFRSPPRAPEAKEQFRYIPC